MHLSSSTLIDLEKCILYKVNHACVHMRFGAFHDGSLCVAFKFYLIQSFVVVVPTILCC
jgi:hypothetical protein